MRPIKNIIEYVSCVILAFVFAYYLYGRGGVLIATVMIVGALVSIALDLFMRKKVSVTVNSGNVSYFAKGELAELVINVSKSSRFPTPFIEITLDASDNLALDDGDRLIRITLVNRMSETVSAKLKTIGCGGGYIAVKEVCLCDYLGFMRLKIPVPSGRAEIGVLPEMIEIVPDRELLKSAVDSHSDDEDEEKESSETSYYFNGTAGYEHRDYIPGDPLKKINWKLSSKRGELLVRLDEQLVSSSRVFVLDLAQKGFGPAPRDRIIQSCFAICLAMMRSGYECELYFYDGGIQHVKLVPSDDPQSLQTMMSRAIASENGIDSFDSELFRDGRGATVFTDERRSEYFNSFISRAPAGAIAFITSDVPAAYVVNMWGVTEDMAFVKL